MFSFKRLSFLLCKSFHILGNNMNRQIKTNPYYYCYQAIIYLTLWFYSSQSRILRINLYNFNLGYCFYIQITATSVSVKNIQSYFILNVLVTSALLLNYRKTYSDIVNFMFRNIERINTISITNDFIDA